MNLFEYASNNPSNYYDPSGLQGTKPKEPKPSPDAVFYICCKGGRVAICDQGSQAFSGWILDCMRKHEDKHVADLTCNGENPCKGKSDGKLLWPTDKTNVLECAAYRAQLECLIPAPMTREIQDERKRIQKKIAMYCGTK